LSRKPSIPTFVYVVPPYGFDPFWPPQAGSPVSGYFPDAQSDGRQEQPLKGRVRLEVEPAALLQIYVDGFYVGTPVDLNGELVLEAGPHSIDMRAPGYETFHLDVNVAPDRSITYRGSLKPASVASPGPTVQTRPDAAPRTPMTIYVIPGPPPATRVGS
jgi:hypothetical protein